MKELELKPYEEAIHTLHNGNHSNFKEWIKDASKVDMLNAIEYSMTMGIFKRHQIINSMRSALEN